MGDMKGRLVRKRTPTQEAEVKPRGLGAEADSPIANLSTESPMFDVDLRSAREYLTLSNRRGTDPYARWCRRGGAVRRPPIRIP